jgi:MinD-like ATPase involved in chromosome partitioning or flagellar assembly
MADYRTNLTNEVIKEVKAYFKEKVYQTVIPRNIKLTEAPGFGKPIALYDKNSIGAQKYSDFANELLGVSPVRNNEISNGVKKADSANILESEQLQKVGEEEAR